ncbi:MAG: DUF115 domain-containing protein [Anaerolineales bacterium]|nr:DUF115 domain-containing protein [Anaerolineales bacterium]
MSAPALRTLKSALPAPLWQAGRATWYGLARAGQWPSAMLHPWRRASIHRLAELRDIHRDQRCFIIGNGPSLKNTDLSRLRDEFTFGMNRIYLAFPKLGFITTYYLSVNSLVIEQCAQDIHALQPLKFLSWRSRGAYQQALPPGTPLAGGDTVFLHTTHTGPKFARDARGRLWEGATVTYVALQLAFHMGFETAILIGVDHSFITQGQPNTTIVSQGEDRDHFHAEYFGKGFRWQLPDLETSERAYCMAREAYAAAGRQVLDATLGGKLTVFPKVDYDSLF